MTYTSSGVVSVSIYDISIIVSNSTDIAKYARFSAGVCRIEMGALLPPGWMMHKYVPRYGRSKTVDGQPTALYMQPHGHVPTTATTLLHL